MGLLTVQQTIQKTGLKRRTFFAMRERGAFPPPDLKLAREPLYRVETVEAWLRQHRGERSLAA
jgi:predicted DNA-binding transcriptional regulator AlpA